MPINADTTQTLLDCLNFARLSYAEKPAYSQRGKTLSFADVAQFSDQIGAFLQAQAGLVKGDRVAIQLPNILAYPIVAFGVIKAGMVIVNVNPFYTKRETRNQLLDAGIKLWFVAEISAHLVEDLRQELNDPLVIVCDLFAMHPWSQRWVLEFYLRYSRRLVKAFSRKRLISLKSALKRGKSLPYQMPKLEPDAIALLQYTGGSTGVLKGAILTHSNLVHNMRQVASCIQGAYQPGSELVIAPLPLYHIFAFNVHCLTPLLTGAHNVLILDATAIGSMVKEMSRWPFTAIAGVNTLFYSLLRFKKFRSLDFRQLRFVIAGGMRVESKLASDWLAMTGQPILEGFGMTELSPVASFNLPGSSRMGSVGRPLSGTEMKIVDANGEDIHEVGRSGELWVRGPQVMRGYWQNPVETASHLTASGWMKTGDVASFDQDGYWYIVGRCKRMILVSGFNVYPMEVEAVIRQHPDVVDCQVIGQPHPVSSETIKAFIVSRNKQLKASEIREHCRQYLTSYKLPRHLEFVSELPAESPVSVLFKKP